MDTSVNIQLFVEILNEYLYYFETNPEVVSPYLLHQTCTGF